MDKDDRLDKIAKDLITNGGHGELYDIVRLAAAWRDRKVQPVEKKPSDKPKWGQNFVKTKGRVLKITPSGQAVVYLYLDKATQHLFETTVPVSQIENGEEVVANDRDISIKEWFVKKEKLPLFT